MEWSGVEWCGGEPGRPDGINSPTKDEENKEQNQNTRKKRQDNTNIFYKQTKLEEGSSTTQKGEVGKHHHQRDKGKQQYP